jgi:hypothetical protein
MAYQYTEEEKLEFRKKDKRISIQGLVQTLLRCEQKNIEHNEIQAKGVVALAKYYSDEIERVVNETVGNIEVDCGNMWVEAANNVGCPVPTEQEQKVLEIIKSETKCEACAILVDVMAAFGKYPKNKQSVSKCVKLFN